MIRQHERLLDTFAHMQLHVVPDPLYWPTHFAQLDSLKNE